MENFYTESDTRVLAIVRVSESGSKLPETLLAASLMDFIKAILSSFVVTDEELISLVDVSTRVSKVSLSIVAYTVVTESLPLF